MNTDAQFPGLIVLTPLQQHYQSIISGLEYVGQWESILYD